MTIRVDLFLDVAETRPLGAFSLALTTAVLPAAIAPARGQIVSITGKLNGLRNVSNSIPKVLKRNPEELDLRDYENAAQWILSDFGK